MDSTTVPKPNPNNGNPKTGYSIGGIQVKFPYQPYGSQLAFMCRVISTLDRAQRDGHCHALLESPTGTGKSLSLLCSTIAWQQHYKLKNQNPHLSHSKPNPEAVTDPLACGGGFIPESQPTSVPPSANAEMAKSATDNKSQKKNTVPTIFFASRTHSQISQAIGEYRKTAYRVPMAVLASRKHYCTNKHVRGKENVDEECKLLIRNQDVGCPEFKNIHKVKHHPSLHKGGCHEVHDIEDLVKVGQIVRGCSYYAASFMAYDAQLVFCPYSYIINPIVRGAMDVDIKGAIVILDEAHNIEDVARDSGSADIEEDNLLKLQMELGQLCSVNATIYQPLSEMTQDIISWIERRKTTLAKRDFQHYCSFWTGDKALRELHEANISQQCFPILLECAKQAIRIANDTESEVPHLGGMSVTTLEGLFSSLTYFFSKNGCHIVDYQLALRRFVKKDAKNSAGDWTCTFSLWCLNPAVVFRDIAELSLSVILTSGTLSPMNSFSSELGVQFGTCLEAPHVIDVASQVWAGVISTSPGDYPLNASYKTADGYAFQDALGKTLEEICNVVPGGCLVFFPSYKLMEKLSKRWHETGQWSRLNSKKPFFIEPKGGSQEDFDIILKDYYHSISQGKKPSFVKKRRVKKAGINHLNATESLKDANKDGAGFLAVCRGKVSEGLDFSDDNARVVIVVGIPFPNIADILVDLKKKYNDTYKSAKNLLSGREWYCYQAFRALNQAIGRCIRHRFDYGAIILLDERFQEESNRAYISKWLRKSIRQYDNFEKSLEGLKSFFREVKDQVGKNMVKMSQNTDNNKDIVLSLAESKELTKNTSKKFNRSDHSGQKVQSVTKYDSTFSQWNSHGYSDVQTSVKLKQDTEECVHDKNDHSIELSKGFMRKENEKLNNGLDGYSLVKHDDTFTVLKSEGDTVVQSSFRLDKDINNCKDYINVECSLQSDSRCYRASTMPFTDEDLELSLVKETPGMGDSITVASPGSFFKDGNSCSTIYQASTQSPDLLSFHSRILPNLGNVPSKTQFEMAVTPEKDFSGNTSNILPEKDFSGITSNILPERDSSLSVNSHAQKRKKFMGSPSVDLANRKIEFGFETIQADHKSKKSNICAPVTINNGDGSHVLSSPIMDKRLQISCSLCRSPLGLHENHHYVLCSLTTSTKVHLVSLMKERMEPGDANVSSVPVIITDISSVDQRFCNRALEGSSEKGIWCEEDGCVYNNLLCPFCSIPKNFLGVQIVACDATNFHLLNKILLYLERLEIRDLEAEKYKLSEVKDSMLVEGTDMDKVAASNSIEKFSYSPSQNSGGWRTTKTKLRLPKKALLSNVET